MEQKQAFTGRKRMRTNRWGVKASDTAARLLITIGGIGTIGAVSAVFLCLAWVVAPLFLPARLEQPTTTAAPWRTNAPSESAPLHLAVDEYQLLGMAFFPDGALRVFRLDTGETLDELQVLEDGPELTAASFAPQGDSVALGFDDGSVRLGQIGFRTQFPQEADLTPEQRQLTTGEVVVYQGGLLQRTSQGELRSQNVVVELQEPVEVASSAIELIDHIEHDRGPLFAIYTADGVLELRSVREKQNLLTGESTFATRAAELPYAPHGSNPPAHLLLNGQGDSALLIWNDGFLRRYAVRDFNNPSVAEEVDLLNQEGASLTAVDFLLGQSTLLVGDSTGRTRAWFRIRPPTTQSSDGTELVAAHVLPGPDSAVTSLAHSSRSRMAAVGYANGEARVYYVTTHDELVRAEVAQQAAIDRLLIAPKDNALLAVAGEEIWQAAFEPGHPEASFHSLFRPVWYEGYAQPEHVWQSGGGTESLEPKLGLMPLVFGTFKATVYSMMFGVPIALLAAIYTSEFLRPKTRARIKPTIELMASLPSVVLGFLAALVFAPIIDQILPATLTAFVTVPTAFLVGAYLWQLAPYGWILRWQRWRLFFIAPFLPLGLLAAYLLGPWVELLLFGGDIMRWLDGQVGGPTGGWMLLLLPVCAVSMAVFNGLVTNPALRRISHDWSRGRLALAALLKFLATALATVLLAWLISSGLGYLAFDPRGSYVDTFDQRNALVVGFVMGFAIIPIIFTIADDALSSVPQHLRSGSLGAGATQWQTAVRIVIPTAMSGLFSAVMIGLGRAVGETMIVLMAAGNTPVMDLNIFNGFRTLSATIAVELPEAARDSTHFRTLFLAALTLFVLTFLVNTVAEVVRLRFRRRAYQL